MNTVASDADIRRVEHLSGWSGRLLTLHPPDILDTRWSVFDHTTRTTVARGEDAESALTAAARALVAPHQTALEDVPAALSLE